MWIIAINEEEPIKYQGVLDELNPYQNTRGKSKIKIIIYIRKRYQRTYHKDIHSIFHQVIPVVSHIEVCLPKKPSTTKDIGEGLESPQI